VSKPLTCVFVPVIGFPARLSVIKHLRATIRAKQLACQWVSFSKGICPFDGLAVTLCRFSRFGVYDGGVGVFKYQPFVLWVRCVIFILICFFAVPKIDSIALVFGFR